MLFRDLELKVQIHPFDTRIRQLFQTAFYQIPRFQRPYSWDRGNVEDFWNDSVASGQQGYFIGSMVLYGGKNGQDLNVVDGQQRLTTITIFLSALRDTFVSIGEDALAAGVQVIIQRPDINNDLRYVLLTESSYPYFQEYVQKLGEPEIKIEPSDEEKGIQLAYRFALGEFRKIVDRTTAETPEPGTKAAVIQALRAVRDALLSLDLIVIQLDNEDDAYVVFETLNTRGKDLEPKDLIKNLLTRYLPRTNATVDVTKIKWNATLKSLANSAANLDMSTYLHHHWLSRYEYTPEKTLFDRFKSRIQKVDAAAYLDEISDEVEIYRRIFEPDNFKWAKEEEPLRRSLQALSVFKVRQPTPLILAILRAYFAKAISLKQARDAVSSIEKFHFMYTAIAGQSSSGGVSMMYAAAARDLSSEADPQKRAKHLQDFRAKLADKLPDRDTFFSGISDLRYSETDTRRRQLIRYVLERADGLERKDAAVDYSKMTIEHVSPQNPPPGTDVDESYPLVGNLLLVSEGLNQKLANKPFAAKKTLMDTAGVPLDATLLAATDWGSAEILTRMRRLSDAVYDATKLM